MSDEDIFEQVALVDQTCCTCAVRFGVTKAFQDLRRKDFRGFYCPSGHCQSYQQPEKERDDELEEAREAVRAMRDEVAAAHAETEQVKAAKRPLVQLRRKTLA